MSPPERDIMILMVDDEKPMPARGDVALARTYDQAILMASRLSYSELWLDFDLGDPHGRTGADALREMLRTGTCPEIVRCISLNPVGSAEIGGVLLDRDRGLYS